MAELVEECLSGAFGEAVGVGDDSVEELAALGEGEDEEEELLFCGCLWGGEERRGGGGCELLVGHLFC